jgi:hypothetical protein
LKLQKDSTICARFVAFLTQNVAPGMVQFCSDEGLNAVY